MKFESLASQGRFPSALVPLPSNLFVTRIDMNLPELGAVAMGITDVQRASVTNRMETEPCPPVAQTYDFHCSCEKCPGNRHTSERLISNDETSESKGESLFLAAPFDLLSTFPDARSPQPKPSSVEPVYESFTLALMTRRKFDLCCTIIIFESDDRNRR